MGVAFPPTPSSSPNFAPHGSGLAPARTSGYGGVELSSGDGPESIDLEALSLFPLKDGAAYNFYLTQTALFWQAAEIKFSDDAADYARLPPGNKRMYQLVVGFFQIADQLVAAQAKSLLADAQTPEEELFLAVQLFIEGQHQVTYGLAAHNVIRSSEDLRRVQSEIKGAPCVRAKWNFILKYRDTSRQTEDERRRTLGRRYLAGAFAEGVFFAGLFAIIFCFLRKGVLKAFTKANEFIIRDETVHRDYNCDRAKRYGGFSVEEAHEMAREAYEIEVAHIRHLLSEPFDSAAADAAAGLTVEALCSYARGLVDQVLALAGIPVLFDAPAMRLPWMGEIGTYTKANFYESLNIDYALMCVADAKAAAAGESDTAAREESAIQNPLDADW